MKYEPTSNRRREERLARRQYRHIVRHRRQAILAVIAGVAIILSTRFLVGRLMNASSAQNTLAETATSVEVVTSTASTEATEEVSIDYLTPDEVRAKSEKPRTVKTQKTTYTNAIDAFLRVKVDTPLYQRASTKSSTVVGLAAGTIVETYGTENGWTKVSSRGQEGYLRDRDLEVISDPNLFKVVDGHVIVNAAYSLDPSYETVFDADAAAALKVMREAMTREGVAVEVATTYRDYTAEKEDLVLRGNPAHAPAPGHAVFQTGFGVQFYAPNTDPRLDNHFEKTDAFRWLKEHAQEYGYVLRYPEGSESITGYRADPTIFYYVGVEDASIISNEGLTLEVFYGVN